MKDSEQKAPADPSELEKVIGHRFRDREILLRALTHSSFCNETDEPVSDNERLEFLGDAIISTVIAEAAYTRFPDAREGELTRLKSVVVAQPGLAAAARRIDLGRYMRLGHGAATADSAATHPGVLCDAFEALVGATYLDGGFDAAKAVILDLLSQEIAAAGTCGGAIDPKTELNILSYAMGGHPPLYTTVETTGPAHAPTFVVEVRVPGGAVFTGRGGSKKAAQQAAASEAIGSIRGSSPGGDDDETAT